MNKQQQIIDYCRQLKLAGIADYCEEALQAAQKQQVSYLDYTLDLLKKELDIREEKGCLRRLKAAQLPLANNLHEYDFTFENGLSKTILNQLRDLVWLDKIYNIILMGPSGTGKTYIAAGLCRDAVKAGYKAYFKTMDDLVRVLKLKDITRSATVEYKRLLKANLIVIDDIMLFPVDKPTAVSLFNFINQLHEKTSFIITTNKAPKEWATMLDDEVLATALLDRLLFRCEVINLVGKSYRMKYRKNIIEI